MADGLIVIARIVPWLLVAALGCGCLALIRRASQQEAETARIVEARELAAAGQIVAAQRDRDGLQADLDALLEENAKLGEALDRARKAAPKAQIVRVMSATTEAVPIDPATMQAFCATYAASQVEPMEGEVKGEIRVASADLETDKGNYTLVGEASCWRVAPTPELKLFDAPFDATLTTVSVLAPVPPEKRWPWYTHEAIGAGIGFAAATALLLRR